MLIVIATIIAIVIFVWWLNRRWLAAERRREAEDSAFARHDQARAHELAKVQADLSRWSGPH